MFGAGTEKNQYFPSFKNAKKNLGPEKLGSDSSLLMQLWIFRKFICRSMYRTIINNRF